MPHYFIEEARARCIGRSRQEPRRHSIFPLRSALRRAIAGLVVIMIVEFSSRHRITLFRLSPDIGLLARRQLLAGATYGRLVTRGEAAIVTALSQAVFTTFFAIFRATSLL